MVGLSHHFLIKTIIMFEYNCPHCEEEMKGSFGDDVYCSKCDKTFETDWDYISEESMTAWLTGAEFDNLK